MATSRVEKAISQASPLVFVSSTFRDMHEEREELVKRVFRVSEFQCYCATVPWGMPPRGCEGPWTPPYPRARRLAVRRAGSTQTAQAGAPGQAWCGGTGHSPRPAALAHAGQDDGTVRTVTAIDGGTRVCREQQTAKSLRPPSGPHGGWDIPGLSHEIREKLTPIQPATLRQAARISGVTPAAVAILMVYFQKYRMQRADHGTELSETPLPSV